MMQPYFFPYLGYFALMSATDRWVVFDTAQYIRRGWVNRNRVLSSGSSDWKYLRVPTKKAPQSTRICEIQISNHETVSEQLINNLDEYRCWRAPFYQETKNLLKDCLSNPAVDLNNFLITCLQSTCDYLEIPVTLQKFSELRIPTPANPQPGDWALSTARHLRVDEYINPPGGRQIFDSQAFVSAGIQLSFLSHNLPPYKQQRPDFISGLSIIDVLMWNGRDRTRAILNDYTLDSAEPMVAA